MGVYEAKIIWERGDQPFLDKRYSLSLIHI